ncbi:MAG: Fic family protein [Spirochaetales bacterium]|nr:Fic family protein [Spirochaetales bacterium]
MEDRYVPPFDMTENIANLTVDICLLVNGAKEGAKSSKNPTLRRKNRIRTIHSSLAIENNSLTEEQVGAVVEGKKVIAPAKDILEVQNAYEAYCHLEETNPYSVDDLLGIHKVFMKDIVDDAGHFRDRGVGVYKGSELLHLGTKPEYVQNLVTDLIDWAKNSKLHPLIKSSIFHYEFEFIHPFSDGNGRTGRFWHTLILSRWNNVFSWIPLESLVHEHQQEYYQAMAYSDREGKSTKFIEFSLRLIKEVLQGNDESNGGAVKDRILAYLKKNPTATAKDISASLSLSSRQVERVISTLKEEGRLVRQGSNKAGRWVVS